MKKLLFFIPLVFFISACENQEDSIQKGMLYLNSIYNDGLYDDQYLLYIYPGEALECPLENCNLTYRLMDAYFNDIFIKEEVTNHDIMKKQVDDADKVLRSIIPIWEKEKIYNTIKGEKDGLALDTYCILGFIYNNSKMASTVKESATGDNWITDDYYKGLDDWRNIADESWCVRFLIKTGYPAEGFIKKEIKDTYVFLQGEHYDMSKVVAAMHTLYVLNDANLLNEDFFFFQDYIAEKSSLFEDDMLYQANVLEALSKTGYKDKEVLEKIAARLKEGQADDGAWYLYKYTKEKNGQVFTTFRAILALNAYENEK